MSFHLWDKLDVKGGIELKILIINVVCGIRSTGRICTDLAGKLEKQGHEVKIAYGREDVPEQYKKYSMRIGNDLDVYLHAFESRVFDNAGFGSKWITEKFIKWIKKYDPDVIHLHNIHGYYINIEVLFNYLRLCGKKIIWTLHDCWAFTGHCCHFSYIGCRQWKDGCKKCVQKKEYPASFLGDACKRNYLTKKKLFCGIDNFEIQVPSKWLGNLVKQSFLKEYKINVVPNWIDEKIFHPVKSNIKEKLGVRNKKIVLGVSTVWNDRKGLYDFYRLANLIDERFIIVLVGLTKNQLKSLPKKIKGFPLTNDVQELVKIYSAADIFVNMSREETFSLTTLEAIKCGTPAIVYKDTACEEVTEEQGGISVPYGDVKAIKEAITLMEK